MKAILYGMFLGFMLSVGRAPSSAEAQEIACSYSGISHEGGAEPRKIEWRHRVGTKLLGANPLDLDGDGRPELLKVVAEVQRDRAINPYTGEQSKQLFCWFNTRLEIRDERKRLIYADHWSIKQEDMVPLLENHSAASPEDYFARFGRHEGYFKTGMEILAPAETVIRVEAIKWSLAAQGLTGVDANQIQREVSQLKVLRLLVYRADWREDLRVVAYVPSLRRAVAIQVGY